MRGIAFLSIFICAFVATLFSLFGEESYPRFLGLQGHLKLQEERNAQAKSQVEELRGKHKRLGTDLRSLEKAARNELGVARPDDLIVVFEEEAHGQFKP